MTQHERQSWGTAVLRVTLGAVFVLHGWLAWHVLGIAGTGRFITSLGFPGPLGGLLAWYLVLAHVVGGGLIVVGLWTSLMALAQVPIMATAVFLIHWRQGFFTRGVVVDPGGGRAIAIGFEYPLLVLAGALALTLLGSGALSVDRWRARGPRVTVP